MKTLRYKLSKDKVGLIKYFRTKGGKEGSYHIHSSELTQKERQIRNNLLRKKKGEKAKK